MRDLLSPLQAARDFNHLLIGYIRPPLIGISDREVPSSADIGTVNSLHTMSQHLHGVPMAGRHYHEDLSCLSPTKGLNPYGKREAQFKSIIEQDHGLI